MARITVEDCLVRENNRFALVVLAARRAKQLLRGAKSLIENGKNKPCVMALREIADGKVRFMTPEEIARVKEAENKQFLEQNKQAASAAVAAAEELFATNKNDADSLEAELKSLGVDLDDDLDDVEDNAEEKF